MKIKIKLEKKNPHNQLITYKWNDLSWEWMEALVMELK